MIPLSTKTFPASAEALQDLMNESLGRVFDFTRPPVTLEVSSFPALSAINISLDDARLRRDPPRPPSMPGKTVPALQVERLTIQGSPIFLEGAALELDLSAEAVRFNQGHDDNGEIVLSLEDAADGKIAIRIAPQDLEALIGAVAKAEAGKQGVTIDDVQLALRSTSSRSLSAEVRLRARKLFLSATIQITGQLDLDGQLNARLSGLRCKGDGAIASMACGFLAPHLQKLDGREFALMAVPLGNIRLRDVRLAVSDKLSVDAEFGSAS